MDYGTFLNLHVRKDKQYVPAMVLIPQGMCNIVQDNYVFPWHVGLDFCFGLQALDALIEGHWRVPSIHLGYSGDPVSLDPPPQKLH